MMELRFLFFWVRNLAAIELWYQTVNSGQRYVIILLSVFKQHSRVRGFLAFEIFENSLLEQTHKLVLSQKSLTR
jgi:hypothetical protein